MQRRLMSHREGGWVGLKPVLTINITKTMLSKNWIFKSIFAISLMTMNKECNAHWYCIRFQVWNTMREKSLILFHGDSCCGVHLLILQSLHSSRPPSWCSCILVAAKTNSWQFCWQKGTNIGLRLRSLFSSKLKLENFSQSVWMASHDTRNLTVVCCERNSGFFFNSESHRRAPLIRALSYYCHWKLVITTTFVLEMLAMKTHRHTIHNSTCVVKLWWGKENAFYCHLSACQTSKSVTSTMNTVSLFFFSEFMSSFTQTYQHICSKTSDTHVIPMEANSFWYLFINQWELNERIKLKFFVCLIINPLSLSIKLETRYVTNITT